MKDAPKEVMLIGEKESFLIRVLMKKLKEAGITAFFVNTDINRIAPLWSRAAVVIYYLDNAETVKPDLLHYLHDRLTESGIKVALIGEKTDAAETHKYLSNDLILDTFLRPLDTDKFITELSEHLSAQALGATKKRILIVDDDPVYLGLVREWLRNKYRVSIANSGLQAIKWLGMNTADLILLDYEMPVTSGPQVLEMLRSDPETSSIPVFFLTGKSDRDSVMQVMSLKPQNYLLKSIEEKELMEKLDQFFVRK